MVKFFMISQKTKGAVTPCPIAMHCSDTPVSLYRVTHNFWTVFQGFSKLEERPKRYGPPCNFLEQFLYPSIIRITRILGKFRKSVKVG